MKVVPHSMIALSVAEIILCEKSIDLRNTIPVDTAGRVRMLDVIALKAGNPHLIGRTHQEYYEPGDLQKWDMSAPGTQRYISPEDISQDTEALESADVRPGWERWIEKKDDHDDRT